MFRTPTTSWRKWKTFPSSQSTVPFDVHPYGVSCSLNRAAQHELEKDSSDKFTALNLDSQCHGMRNTSRGLAYHDGIERVDNTTSVPESWAKYSNNNIQRSQSERAASTDKRNQIEQLLNKCHTAMINQWNTVKNALTDRIRECMDAKNKLQTNLSQVSRCSGQQLMLTHSVPPFNIHLFCS